VLIYAAEKACAYTLNTDEPLERCIKTFLERRVGPKGSNISGGEKQRVACARALLRDSRVFLMDEGTSALDIITERKVLNGMMEELETRTMVNVAHRIETIKDSDRIFLFDQGELRESGSYEELMEKKRYFYNFA
jgi:ATP-binding cassette subfamily B (MDR/TAP) protein 1